MFTLSLRRESDSHMKRTSRWTARVCCIAAYSLTLAAFVGCSDAGTGPGRRTEVPQELVGQWQGAISAGGTFLNDYLADAYDLDGVNLPDEIEVTNNTLGYAWYFYKDGRYEHVWIWTMFVGYCGQTIAWEEHGTVEFSGSLASQATIKFHPTTASTTLANQCGPSSEGRATGKPLTVTAARVTGPDGNELLQLGFPSGNDLVLNRP